jgi:MEKHLA domain
MMLAQSRSLVVLFLFLLIATASNGFAPTTFVAKGCAVPHIPEHYFRSCPSRCKGSVEEEEQETVRIIRKDEFDVEAHLRHLSASLEKATSKSLAEHMKLDDDTEEEGVVDNPKNVDAAHLSMRFALMSHGTGTTTGMLLNNYANFAALAAFRYSRTQMCTLPASHMAQAGSDREHLAITLMQLQNIPGGHLPSYEGFRCTKDLRKFYIKDAIVR